jgi:hypothetical protein
MASPILLPPATRAATLSLALTLLAGCATCRDHPAACAVAGAVVAGSTVAIVAAHNHHHATNPGGCVGYYEGLGDSPSQAAFNCR